MNDTLNWIDTQRDPMVETLLAWSRINSGSLNVDGVNRFGQAVAEAFKVLQPDGIETLPVAPLESVDSKGEVQHLPLGNAVRIRKHGDAPVKILLMGHLDTVFPVDSPFQEPRMLDDNTVNGPGVADLKGGLVVMLTALEALERSEHAGKIGWEVLLNPDEEIGSQGSDSLMQEAAARNHFGLIYEPALPDGTLAGARKGSGNFITVIKGRAAHAGRDFASGRNAIAAMAEYVQALYALNGQQEGVTLNPGKIEGGGPVNVVPDTAILRFNVRMETAEQKDWLATELEKLDHLLDGREGFSLARFGGFTRPPKQLSAKNEELFALLKDCGVELGLNVAWQKTGGCCDGNNLAAYGLPNIDTLGVRGGKIHSHDEFALLDSLTERAKLSFLLLQRLAGSEIAHPARLP